jgi:hypothetical protein
MGASRRSDREPIVPRSPELAVANAPADRSIGSAGAKRPDRGYNPYDTVTTRISDIWGSKPKRA